MSEAEIEDYPYSEFSQFLGECITGKLEYEGEGPRKAELLERWGECSGNESIGKLVQLLACAIGRLNMLQMQLLRDLMALSEMEETESK